MRTKSLNKDDLSREVGIAVGTRPGIIMLAPLIHEFRRRGIPCFVIHTGQHYSPNMDGDIFSDLGLPTPDYRLEGVAEKPTHGGQTAAMLEGIEKVLLDRRPCMFLVGGDANTNLAGALAARKLHIDVGHIEAGERSYDWRMPEEHNRTIIDHISDYLFVTNKNSVKNLEREGIHGQIYVVGNLIVDASRENQALAMKKSNALHRFGLAIGDYGLLTTHREENVDNPVNLRGALEGVSGAAQKLELPILFLAHPRTIKQLREFGLSDWVASLPRLKLVEAVAYFDFLALLSNARLIFTDSGGVQQEACIHNVPCVTLRENTEWIETVTIGANRLAGCAPDRIVAAAVSAMAASTRWTIPFGDGTTASQIADIVQPLLDRRRDSHAPRPDSDPARNQRREQRG